MTACLLISVSSVPIQAVQVMAQEMGISTYTYLPGDSANTMSESLGVEVTELDELNRLRAPGNRFQYDGRVIKITDSRDNQEYFYDVELDSFVDASQIDNQAFNQSFRELAGQIKPAESSQDSSAAVSEVLDAVTRSVERSKESEKDTEDVPTDEEIETLEKELEELENRPVMIGGLTLPNITTEDMNRYYDAALHNATANPENGGLHYHVAVYKEFVGSMFGITSYSLYRPGDPQDHGQGKAIDFMVPVSSTLGDMIASYAVSTMDHYGVSYVIWKQHIFGDWNRTWVPMEDRGSITQNHYDHVHVSFN